MTFAEVRLWKYGLRASLMKGYPFHRQWPMFGYIADFYCKPLSLVIEVDGPSHDGVEQRAYDARRDSVFARNGARVLRLTNADVVHHLDRALKVIEVVIEEIERQNT